MASHTAHTTTTTTTTTTTSKFEAANPLASANNHFSDTLTDGNATQNRNVQDEVASVAVSGYVGVSNPTQEVDVNKKLDDMAKKTAKQQKKWNKRLKVFFCCLGYKKNKDSIADVASIFAEFFADLNVPSSDLAAGFVLLSKYQAAQREWIIKHKQLGIEQFLSGVPIKSDTKFLDISTADDSHLVNDLIYYMNYSLAIFGWPLQMIDDPFRLCCCICPYLELSPCCSSRRKTKKKQKETENTTTTSPATKKKRAKSNQVEDVSSTASSPGHSSNNDQPSQPVAGRLSEDCDTPIVLDDNCCRCNYASAESRLGSHNYEIIYINYRVNVAVVPFLVAADHSKRTIVVAIRGSMGLADMVTDMNGQVDKIPLDDCPDDWLCHRGMTGAASYVKRSLISERILDAAFNCRPDLGSQDYSLVLCGHSLGAGAAAILGILLRPLYPTLRAYLYSPPGGILSMSAVEYTKQFAIGIILGNDSVPRLGVAQLERLRYQAMLSLQSTETSSSRILARAFCPTCCVGSNKVDYDPNQSIDLLYGQGGRSFKQNGLNIPFQVQPQVLYVPGKLIHIVKNYSFESSGRRRRFFNGPVYQAVWTENASYDRIIICKNMFLDHLPHQLMSAMKMLFLNTLPDRRTSSIDSVAGAKSEQTTNPVLPQNQQNEPKTLTGPDATTIENKLTPNDVIRDENNNYSNMSDGGAQNHKIEKAEKSVYPSLKQVQVDGKITEALDELHLCDEPKNLDENANEFEKGKNGNTKYSSQIEQKK